MYCLHIDPREAGRVEWLSNQAIFALEPLASMAYGTSLFLHDGCNAISMNVLIRHSSDPLGYGKTSSDLPILAVGKCFLAADAINKSNDC